MLVLTLTALVTISLASCRGREDENSSDEYAEGYIFAFLDEIPYRIHVENGTITPLCQDPLCFHDDRDCPFYDIKSDADIHGRYINYLSGGGDIGYATRLCRYDIKSSKYEVIYEPKDGSLLRMSVLGDFVFMNLKSHSDQKYYPVRYDIKSERSTVLVKEGFTLPQLALSLEDEGVRRLGDAMLTVNIKTGEYKILTTK